VELRLDPWEFAVSLTELLAAGLTGTDVRRLVAGGLAEHAHERLRLGSDRRSFHPMTNLALTARTCFVLTPAGERLLKQWDGRVALNGNDHSPALLLPRWDAERRQLWYGDQLVKWYRQPADSQQTILAAFEEEGWPPRIDDPLPKVHGIMPRDRLHDTLKRLNRDQLATLLLFRRDGSGEGVEWVGR
jgi:hypothetical protein